MAMQDWDALYRTSGIKSFMAVPIGGAGEVLGLLTIAKQEPGAFNDEWCVAVPGVAQWLTGRQWLTGGWLQVSVVAYAA